MPEPEGPDLFPGNHVLAVRCISCSQTLPITEFYTSTRNASSPRCIECLRQARGRSYRKTSEAKRTRYKQNLRVNLRQRLYSAGFRGEACAKTLEALLAALQEGECPYCGTNLTAANYSIDHKIPIAGGGPATDPANLQLICTICNRGKGKLSDQEYRAFIARVIGFHIEPQKKALDI